MIERETYFIRRLPRWLLLCVTAIVAAHTLYLSSFSNDEYLARFAIGDALVYARVAFNVAFGLGSTFDLSTTTNGYHPLWMWLHIPFFIGADSILERLALLRVFWIVVALAAALLWGQVLYRLTSNALAATLMVLLVAVSPYSTFVLYSGLETALVLLCCAGLILYIQRLPARPSAGQAFLFGLIVAATFLSRLDSILFILPLLLCTQRCWAMLLPKCIFSSFLGFTLPVLPYLSWNLAQFSSLLPVSGQVKTLSGIDASRSVQLVSDWLGRFYQSSGVSLSPAILFGVAIFSCVAAVYLLLKLQHKAPQAVSVAGPLLLGAIAQYAYYLFFMRELNIPWHVYPQAVMFFFFCVLLFHIATSSWLPSALTTEQRSRTAAGMFVICIVALTFVWKQYDAVKAVSREQQRALIRLHTWFIENTQPGARISMYDSFLLAAYLPRHFVFDLNGLVGDQQLAQFAKYSAHDKAIEATKAEYIIAREPAECQVALEGSKALFRSSIIKTTSHFRFVILPAQVFIEAWRRNPDLLCVDGAA
jgi:hypothetical protein